MWVTYIYGLVDPRDGRVRYVGQSQDPERRYREHLRASLRLSNVFGLRHPETGRYLGNPYYGQSLYARWLEELAACRLDPELVILQTVRRKGWDVGQAAAYLLEWEWAHRQRAWGPCACHPTPDSPLPPSPQACWFAQKMAARGRWVVARVWPKRVREGPVTIA